MTRLALFAPLVLLLSAAAPLVVPLGTFRTWGVYPSAALRLRSGGLTIDVAAQPCLPNPQTEGCRLDGVNNQATITVTAPGLPPFSMTSDRQASFVRGAAVRLDRRDSRPGVVVDNQWGGSAGLTTVSIIQPVAGGFRLVPIQRDDRERQLEGEIADNPADRSGDGRIDLVLGDPAFDTAFGCNACTPRPAVVLSVVDGRSVDLSTSPAVRPVFARQIVAVRTM